MYLRYITSHSSIVYHKNIALLLTQLMHLIFTFNSDIIIKDRKIDIAFRDTISIWILSYITIMMYMLYELLWPTM
ncbi:hypothetical protein CEAn_00646 [Coxiella endosymbiont of Amblyomma nuttalli]|nr:hypothetical protein CEAn_00646 [Coxiella endosymbiont of Amblyomma nuttalli]